VPDYEDDDSDASSETELNSEQVRSDDDGESEAGEEEEAGREGKEGGEEDSGDQEDPYDWTGEPVFYPSQEWIDADPWPAPSHDSESGLEPACASMMRSPGAGTGGQACPEGRTIQLQHCDMLGNPWLDD
jgi:hypothetical protein